MNRAVRDECDKSSCCCNPVLQRRDFLLSLGIGSLAAIASQLPVTAGPFEAKDFDSLVPADKKLDPEWVKSLLCAERRPSIAETS